MNDSSKTAAKHEPLRVYIAADSVEEAERTAGRLRAAEEIKVVGLTSRAADVASAFGGERPAEVLITDIVLGGADMAPLLDKIKHRHEGLDILVVTAYSQDPVVIRAILAGATGYILKGGHEDLITSVRLLRGGGSPVSPTVARSVLRAIHARSLSQPAQQKAEQSRQAAPARAEAAASDPRVSLSQRESEIIMLLAKGISFSDIGSILGISPHTVTAHIKKIYKKLGVHSRGEAVYEATCMGLLNM